MSRNPPTFIGYVINLGRSPKGGRLGVPLGQAAQLSLLDEFARRKGAKLARTYVDFSANGTSDLQKFKEAVKACHRLRAKLIIADLATALAYIPLNVEVSKLVKAPLEPTPYVDALELMQERHPLPASEMRAARAEAERRDRRYNYKRRWRAGFPTYPVTEGFILNPIAVDEPIPLNDKYSLLFLAMARHGKVLKYSVRRERVLAGIRESNKRAGLAAPERCYSNLEPGSPEYEARRQADELRRRRAAVTLANKADRKARAIEDVVKEIIADGHSSLRAISRELASRTDGEIRIPHTSVRNYLKRLGLG